MKEILEEQARYHRERAPGYDDWWFRRGRLDGGEEENGRLFAEAAERQYNLCPLAFWLSHVPEDRWDLGGRATAHHFTHDRGAPAR